MNTHSETFIHVQLVCSVINDALIKAITAIPQCRSVHFVNFSEKYPLLNFYANFILHLVQMWAFYP